jgi:hypothetical protein
MNLNSYSVYDHVIPNCLEAGDIIRWEDEVYIVKDFQYVSDGFIINAIDDMEDEIELLIPDNAILPLLEEE